jgi:hypothetical protein
MPAQHSPGMHPGQQQPLRTQPELNTWSSAFQQSAACDHRTLGKVYVRYAWLCSHQLKNRSSPAKWKRSGDLQPLLRIALRTVVPLLSCPAVPAAAGGGGCFPQVPVQESMVRNHSSGFPPVLKTVSCTLLLSRSFPAAAVAAAAGGVGCVPQVSRHAGVDDAQDE